MLKDLAPGVKISITRSITTVFEQYMARINWEENKYDLNEFIHEWREYIGNNASWFDKVSEEMKVSPSFHEDLAQKINETIQKILSEEPTAEQIAELEQLQEKTGNEISYSCKAEAKYLLDCLSSEQSKKKSS